GGNEELNCKPNYLSDMNYIYSFNSGGIADPKSQATKGNLARSNPPLDYSDGILPPLDPNNLNEAVGVGGVPRQSIVYGVGGKAYITSLKPGAIGIDWNGNFTTDNGSVLADITNASSVFSECGMGPTGRYPTLNDYNDWANLVYDFRTNADFAGSKPIAP